jgi:hypothetical protein
MGKRTSTSFQKGKSGNPGGKPKNPAKIVERKILADIKGLAREYAPQAIKTLKGIMANPKAPANARVSAASTILDRAYGKAPQSMDVNGNVTFTLEQLVLQAREIRENRAKLLNPPTEDGAGCEVAPNRHPAANTR